MPYKLMARSGPDNLWIVVDKPPQAGPWLGRDGEDLDDLIANGETDRLGFVPRFVRQNSGKVRDLIWATGGSAKVVKPRFIDVLVSIGATGYRTFPVEVRGRRGESIGDFVGLAILDGDPTKDLYFSNGWQFWEFAAADRVVDALRAANVTDLLIRRVTP